MSNKQDYMARMELNRQNKLATGLLSERFPQISSVVIQMTYYQRGINPILMLRTVNIFPNNSAYFNMECAIKDCIGGGFDLTSVIADMIKGRKKSGKGKFVCSGKIEEQFIDHASIDYEVTIQYNKKKAS